MTNQEKKLKIRSLLARLDALEGSPVGREVDALLEEEAELARKLVKGSPTTKAVKRLTEELDKVKKDPTVRRLSASLDKANKDTSQKIELLVADFGGALSALQSELRDADTKEVTERDTQVRSILERFYALSEKFEEDYAGLDNKNALIEGEVARLWQELSRIFVELSDSVDDMSTILVETDSKAQTAQQTAEEVKDALDKLERSLITRIAQIATGERGGGNMNRNIAVGGNQSVLGYYTDINLKAGAGTQITYTPNHATGFTDITITATGSGSGITRQVNNVSTPTTMDATAGVDQVYLVSGNTTMTLPTAVGNTNLYTIKNVGAGTVIIDTTGGETIDGDLTVTMPVQFTSVDIISNGSNWQIT